MVSPINNLLDPSLGIQDILDPGLAADGQLPQARPLAASVLREAGLEELYSPQNAAKLVEQALCPDVAMASCCGPRFSPPTCAKASRPLRTASIRKCGIF